MRRRIEVPVKIPGIIGHVNIATRRGFPFNNRQKARRVIFQDKPVIINPLQNRRRNRKHNTGGIKSPLRKQVMDQVAVNTSIAVHEGVNINKAERKYGGGDNGIELPGGSRIESDHAGYQYLQILGPGTDMVRQGHTRFKFMLTNKPALFPKAKCYEACIFNDDPLQTQQLFEIERLFSGLSDRPAPALNAVLGCALTFDGVARPGIFKQKKGGCAGKQIARHICDHIFRALRKVHGDEPVKVFGPEDKRTKFRGAGKIVFNAVA